MSNASSTRIELVHRPSWLLALALTVLALLAAACVLASALPPAATTLVPVLWAAALAGHWRSAGATVLLGGDGVPRIVRGGRAWRPDHLELGEAGPLAVLACRDAHHALRLLFGPDTLPRGGRRELRLWVRAHQARTAAQAVPA